MARIPSNMLPLGSELPDFCLQDTVSGKDLKLSDLDKEKPCLVMFICNHCPFVIHLHEGIVNLYQDYKNSGLQIIAVSANDVANYPEDSPENMKQMFKRLALNFPYLYDEDQSFAKALDAACTPDFYLFDGTHKLAYRGRFDESRPGNAEEVSGKDLRLALDTLLKGEKVSDYQKPSLGCNIKWKE
jgi:peroxiredoxin